MDDLSLTVRRTINASPEKIFNAWLDPVMMAKFMSPGANMHVREARSDARVGGTFFVMMVDGKDIPHSGTYHAITPYSRLVFSWESPYSFPDTTVEITLTPVPDGTEVVLTQVKFASEQSRDGHLGGWTGILAKLDALFA